MRAAELLPAMWSSTEAKKFLDQASELVLDTIPLESPPELEPMPMPLVIVPALACMASLRLNADGTLVCTKGHGGDSRAVSIKLYQAF